jgi:hypothetical protein
VNTLIELQLSEPISAVSLPANALTLTANGQQVAGVVSMPSTATLSFTPAAPLAIGTSYTIAAAGFTDLAGNPVPPFSSSFTTGSTSTGDTTPGNVLSVSPADGASNVPVTTSIVATFSKAVNPLTVNNTSMIVVANGTQVAGTYTVSGTLVTFALVSPLPGAASVQVMIQGVQDLAGNIVSPCAAAFTTAATVDTTVPTVMLVTPSNGASGIGLNGQVVVVFSKSMNRATLTSANVALLAGGSPLGFTLSVSADNRTLVILGQSLPGSSLITLVLSNAITDLSGNPLASYSSQFSTAAASDTASATVVTQRPGNGATGVALAASPIVLFLNKPVNAATVPGAIHVVQNGQLVAGTTAVVGNGQTIEFTPQSAWIYGALVQVFLDATVTDLNGAAATAYSGSFSVVSDPATIVPTLVNVSPPRDATNVPLNTVLSASFSVPIDATTVTPNTVLLQTATARVPATPTLNATGTAVTLVPASPLAANTVYYFVLNNLFGVNGKVISASRPNNFTTGQSLTTVSPVVSIVSPSRGTAGVPLNASIGLQFNVPIDSNTVTATSVTLTGGGQTLVPASIAFSNENQTVEITPLAPLPPSTLMTISVNGVTDVAANSVAPFTSTFTTGLAPATVLPGITATNPFAGASGVPTNVAIALQSNTALDGTTASASSFQVYDTTLMTEVAGTYSLSTDGKTVHFVPSAPLATGRTYTVSFINLGIADTAGNLLDPSCPGCLSDFSFTTGSGASSTAPQVTGVSPASGLQGVPIDAQIVTSFNEPVNANSLAGVTLTANGNTVPIDTTLNSGNQLLTLTAVSGLTPNTPYTLTVSGLTDLAGNAMTVPFSSTLTTSNAVALGQAVVSSSAPAADAIDVPSNTSVTVEFSKAMNPLSFTNSSFNVGVAGFAPLAGTIAVNQAGTSAVFTPAVPLGKQTLYTVSLTTGVVDLEGQAAAPLTYSFTTGNQ